MDSLNALISARAMLAASRDGPALTAERLVENLLAGRTPPSFEAELDGWIATADRARTHRLGDFFCSDEELLTFYRDYLTTPPAAPGWSAFLRQRLLEQYDAPLRASEGILGDLNQSRLSIPDMLDFATPDSVVLASNGLNGAQGNVPRMRPAFGLPRHAPSAGLPQRFTGYRAQLLVDTLPQCLLQSGEALCAATDLHGKRLLDPDQQAAVTLFLHRLQTTAEWALRPEEVVGLCAELFAAMRFNTELRDAVASIAADATSSCEDNVGSGFNCIRLLLRFHQAGDLAGRLEVLRQLHLHDVVMKETVRLYGSNASNVDLLQRALAFTVRLRQLGFLQDGGIAETVYRTRLPEADYATVAIAAIETTQQDFAAFASRSGWLANDPEVNDPQHRIDLENIDEAAYAALESATDPAAMEDIQARRLLARGEALSAAIDRASGRKEAYF